MLVSCPEWLPDLIPFSGFPDWDSYIEKLYEIFDRDFIAAHPMYRGKPVFYDARPRDGKPEGFWHVITSSDPSEVGLNREFSLLRCERIGWIRPIIENYGDASVLVWEKEDKKPGQQKHCLFLADQDFIVVLVERGRFFLATAYYVNYESRKRRLIEEFNSHKAKTAPATGTV